MRLTILLDRFASALATTRLFYLPQRRNGMSPSSSLANRTKQMDCDSVFVTSNALPAQSSGTVLPDSLKAKKAVLLEDLAKDSMEYSKAHRRAIVGTSRI